MTGARNGTISLWNGSKIDKSVKMFDEWTLVLYKGGRIFAASKNKDVVELNMNLEPVKKFSGRNRKPYTIDANDIYLVTGYPSGCVDVHSRKKHDTSGTQQPIMVSYF